MKELTVKELLKIIDLLDEFEPDPDYCDDDDFDYYDNDLLAVVVKEGIKHHKDFVDKIIETEHPRLIWILLNETILTPEQIVKIVNSKAFKIQDVRVMVAKNINTPKTVLLQLLQDKNKEVSEAAKETLKKLSARNSIKTEDALLFIIKQFFDCGIAKFFVEHCMTRVPKETLKKLFEKLPSVKEEIHRAKSKK